MLIAVSKDGADEHLGEMVGVAGVSASDVGGLVLRDDGLATDGDEVVDPEVVEIGLVVEEALAPGVVGSALVVGAVNAIVENLVHSIA